jgi:hypothetical protein
LRIADCGLRLRIAGLPIVEMRIVEMRMAELDLLAARLVDAVARDEPLGAPALTFLLRHYLATGREGLGDAVGVALAGALPRGAAEQDVTARADWLTLFAEATALSDDERLLAAAAGLLGGLREEWPSAMQVAEAAASVDACLRAADVAGLVDPRELVPAAIDQLERIVGGAYRPGGGMAATIHGGAHVRGNAADQVRSASALLTAFERSARLPYSMLAEELIQPTRREAAAGGDAIVACETARVLCRLAALHADEQYRGAAVVAPDADYGADADRMLSAHAASAPAGSLGAAAAYGLAVGEWLAFAVR